MPIMFDKENDIQNSIFELVILISLKKYSYPNWSRKAVFMEKQD